MDYEVYDDNAGNIWDGAATAYLDGNNHFDYISFDNVKKIIEEQFIACTCDEICEQECVGDVCRCRYHINLSSVPEYTIIDK